MAEATSVSTFATSDAASVSAQLAMELQRNRELSRELYSLRGEAPPNDNASVHSMLDEPNAEARSRSWEVYGSMPGMDSLYTGASKRTPTGGFFSS